MKTIPGVPESITNEQYLGLVAGAGFDVRHVRKLEFRTDGIYAEVYHHDENGSRYHADCPDHTEAACHRVWIPVVG